MPTQKGGGSIGQSLRYVDPAAPERSAPAGSNLLKESGLIARPAIGGGTRKKSKGGFYPSVMKGVVNAGIVLAPLTAVAARRLFNKSRKGGTRKGNRFAANKEEAKRQLENIGKPSAANVLAFVAAKRRGSEAAEEYVSTFRKKKQEKEEANEAKRRAKEEKKAAKAAARAAKKASRKAKKAKPSSDASTVSTATTVSSANTNNNSYRPPTKAQLMREAEENAARAKAEMAAAKAAAKKPLKNSQVAWMSLIENAQAKLKANGGVPTRKNAMKFASLLKQGKAEEANAFLANFRGRSRKASAKAKTPPARPATPPPRPETPPAAEAPKKAKAKKATAAAAAGNNGTAKKRKPATEAQQAYFNALRTAGTVLKTFGKPRPSNRAKWASLKVSKKPNAAESLAKFEQNFAKRSTAAPPKVNSAPKKEVKPLSAVNEANENNMQGYEENFESESSNE